MVMCIGGPDSIGKTVRAARETKDWGPATLAKHAGIPAAMVHAIEAGREDIPLTTIRRCMVALNLYLAWEVLPKEAIEGDSK